MGRKKKAVQLGKNAAAKEGEIVVDTNEGSNKPLSLLMVPYYADADEDCFKNDDTPDHYLPVSLLGQLKMHKGRSFSDHKYGDTSLASYTSASTSASAKILPPVLKKEYKSKHNPTSRLECNILRAQ
jgi:hypothetical protein